MNASDTISEQLPPLLFKTIVMISFQIPLEAGVKKCSIGTRSRLLILCFGGQVIFSGCHGTVCFTKVTEGANLYYHFERYIQKIERTTGFILGIEAKL